MPDIYASTEEQSLLRDFRVLSQERKNKITRFTKLMARAERAERRIEKELELYAKDDLKGIRCSFCGKSPDEAKRMIAGPFDVYICDECVGLCSEILADPEIMEMGESGEE